MDGNTPSIPTTLQCELITIPKKKLGAMLTTVQCTHHVEQESGLLPSKHCHDETKPRQARADENRGESAS